MPDKAFSMTFSMKLVQLPVPEVHSLYSEGNIPLAAGYLAASARRGPDTGAGMPDIRIIPRPMANSAGDAAIVEWLLEGGPTAVGFTSYMWNLERNLHLAAEIKKKKPTTSIILGGPESLPDNPLPARALQNNIIDAMVVGEGEGVIRDFIRDALAGNRAKERLKPIYRGNGPVDLGRLANPYLENILVPWQNESMFLETMRGCPYGCQYCFYSKSFSGLRFFPGDDLAALFRLARERGVPEIYLMDPSFNVTPKLKEKLEQIGRLNTTGIPIHTEIRPESVTGEIAALMKAAGFRSVEVGLQSVNPAALAAIGRTWDREKFIRGTRHLTDRGINVKTGIILGLPHDGPEDIEKTLDFVMDLELAESMEIYPLSLIPGTGLRDRAAELGIRYMPLPPYWVLSTPKLAEKDIKFAVEMVENKLGIEFFPPIIPLFPGSPETEGPYRHFLDLREDPDGALAGFLEHPGRVGHSLTVMVGDGGRGGEKGSGLTPHLARLGRWLGGVSPFTLVQLVLDLEKAPPRDYLDRLAPAFYRGPRYFDRIHHYKADTQGRYSLRMFHLTADLGLAESYLYEPRYCDLLLKYSPALLERGRDLLEEKPLLLLEGPVPTDHLRELKRIYHGYEEFLLILKLP